MMKIQVYTLRNTLHSVLLLITAGFALSNCTKEIDEPIFKLEPSIRIVSQSSTDLLGFADTLRLILAYEDGDGDLGGLDTDSRVYVQDSRLESPDLIPLGRLNDEDQKRSIQGQIEVALGPYFTLGNASSENFELEIWLTDRAGHESNHVVTQTLSVRQP